MQRTKMFNAVQNYKLFPEWPNFPSILFGVSGKMITFASDINV